MKNFGADVWSQTQFWKRFALSFGLSDLRHEPFDADRRLRLRQYGCRSDGDSYTQTETFTLPQGIGGTADDPQTYYLYVIADKGADVSRA